MTKNTFIMNSFLKSTNIATFAVALMFAIAAPQMAQATTISSAANLVSSSSETVTSTSGSTGSSVTATSGGPSAGQNTTSGAITQFACAVSVSDTNVRLGESVTFSWDSSTFSNLTINGATVTGGNYSVNINSIGTNIFQIAGFDTDGNPCAAQIIVVCNPIPVDCRLDVIKTVDKSSARPGDELTYTISVTNTGTTNCTGGVKIVDVVDPNIEYLRYSISSNLVAGYDAGSITYDVYEVGSRTLYFDGAVLTPGESGTITWVGRVSTPSQCGDFEVHNQARATAYELNNFLTWVRSATVTTAIDYDCPNPTAPSCDSFTASPSTIVPGGSSTLTWETTNATSVSLNNGIGQVSADGSVTVSPTTNTTYILTVTGTNGTVDCSVPVTVTTTPLAPSCDSFTASPSTVVLGQSTVLRWETTNAQTVTLTGVQDAVPADGSFTFTPTVNTTYVLSVVGVNGSTVKCEVPVTVTSPQVFTCPNNVDFSTTDSSIRRGESITLNWNVTGADSVSITGIGSVSSTGSRSFSPNSDTTYTLTATKAGYNTIDCPVRVNVSSGGGGGGSSSPRCDLDISDTRITRGETITLSWDTSRARDITITDNRGNVIVETEEDDGEIEVTPTRDTKYTLVAERGSRDRECEVEVEVEEGQVLGVVRDQQPLVAGIALSQVPYTGFEAGPVLTFMFYVLLMAWALYIAYFLLIRKKIDGSFATATIGTIPGTTPDGVLHMKKAESVRPDAFVAATAAPVAAEAPTNLPTDEKTVGNESYFAGALVTENQADQIVTDLENRAHSQRTLLSSDAIAFFMAATEGSVDRNQTLDEVIAQAKASYPLEDGWVVLNQTRMGSLCETMNVRTIAAHESLPTGSGSLAEAIVTGNIVAAYEMIGNRPMFALAEAAADLDSVVRHRKGDKSPISDLLSAETKNLSDQQLQNMITALTGAIDGTYTDEASAVKMAIMKAVKEIA